MSGGFSDPIIGGGGALVYPSIHSPNFVTQVSGWTINKDGSAEFNNLTIRGTFKGTNFEINSSGAFFYSGTPALGNLVASIAPAGGTDSHGNIYYAGIVVYNPSGLAAAASIAQLLNANLNVGTNGQLAGTGGASPGQLGLATVTPGSLSLTTGLAGSTDVAALITMLSKTANGGIHAISLNGALVLSPETSPAAQANAALWSDFGSGFPLARPAAGADGNVYDMTRLSLFTAADIPINNNVSPITIKSKAVAAGTYEIDGILYGMQGPSAIGAIVHFNGPAVSFNRIYIESNADGNTSVTDSNLSGALPVSHTTPAWGTGVNFYVRFRGILTFSAAGTFSVQGLCNGLSTNTWTAKAASILGLYPVVAS
jgi:hypothetical protein